jgi:hypothetical protein
MKFNQASFTNLPETGDLVWFALDPSGGGLNADKNWVPALWIGPCDDCKYGHTTSMNLLINGNMTRCNIGRVHRGDAPPDEGDAWT